LAISDALPLEHTSCPFTSRL